MRRVDKLVLRIAHKMLKICERRDTYWHGNIFTFFTRYNANDDCQIIKYVQYASNIFFSFSFFYNLLI